MLGAWADVTGAHQILDIGAGTGVIALMLAQRSKAQITALEPAYEAFSLARDNFQNSSFADRTLIKQTSLQDFHSAQLFDLIVCNPPYFENSLKPPTAHRQQQRHTDSLSHNQLLEGTNRLLNTTGRLAVVLPTEEGNRFMEQAAKQNFYIKRSTAVFSKVGKPQERWLLEFGKQATEHIEQSSLSLLDATGQWTQEYRLLTSDFYLKF